MGVSKSIDPAIVYFNVGYRHTFKDKQFGSTIQPGQSLTYSFGAGMSVNRSVSFSDGISGSYQQETKRDGTTIQGSSSEPISLTGSMNYRINKKNNLQTSLSMGLTDDAATLLYYEA